MSDFPRSLIAFQQRFASEEDCAVWLAAERWPDGFRCPACGHDRAFSLKTKPWTYECSQCRRQTSVKAGTILHGSKLPLTVWFWAAYLMATHSNGLSALQMQKQLGLGSYKTAWLLAAKLRRAMVAPERAPLAGLVEVDETTIAHRTKDDPPAGGRGRSHDGKLLVVGAVEVSGQAPKTYPGRVRLAAIKDFSAQCLHDFITANIVPESTARTDGWSGYSGAKTVDHQPHVIGTMAAHVVLPWIHRVFSNLKTWALGVYHGLRAKHLQSYLDEFVFRFNRRKNRPAAFRSLLTIATSYPPITYNMLITPEPKG